MTARRRKMLLGLLGTALLGAGCMTKPLRSANADGTYCHRTGKSYRPKLTCTPGPIPAEQVEAQARKFAATPDQLTVYVVRKRWGDTGHVLRLSTPAAAAIDTVPEAFARWRLPPGQHQLTLTWSEGTTMLAVTGQAGDVLFVEVIGTIWAWGSNYRLELGEPTDSRRRASVLRLVAEAG